MVTDFLCKIVKKRTVHPCYHFAKFLSSSFVSESPHSMIRVKNKTGKLVEDLMSTFSSNCLIVCSIFSWCLGSFSLRNLIWGIQIKGGRSMQNYVWHGLCYGVCCTVDAERTSTCDFNNLKYSLHNLLIRIRNIKMFSPKFFWGSQLPLWSW